MIIITNYIIAFLVCLCKCVAQQSPLTVNKIVQSSFMLCDIQPEAQSHNMLHNQHNIPTNVQSSLHNQVVAQNAYVWVGSLGCLFLARRITLELPSA